MFCQKTSLAVVCMCVHVCRVCVCVGGGGGGGSLVPRQLFQWVCAKKKMQSGNETRGASECIEIHKPLDHNFLENNSSRNKSKVGMTGN